VPMRLPRCRTNQNNDFKNKSKTQQHQRKTSTSITRLTRISTRTLLFTCNPSASALAPSSPMRLPPCRTNQNNDFKNKSKTQQHQRKTSTSITRLTRCSTRTLLFTCNPSASALAPSSPMLLPPCRTNQNNDFKNKSKTQQHQRKTSKSITRLTSDSSCTLLFTCNPSASALAPSSPM
jgi:hypothetical protein